MPTAASFNPFPGLRPFRTDEDYLFFGREGQSEEILRRLRVNRFLAVVGISGSGKSSLIRAGLLPYIFGGFMAGAGSHWRVAVFRPGSNPIGNLARALNDPAMLGEPHESEEDAARNSILLEVTLQRSGLGLIEAVRLARLPEQDNILIVVDQFEELFRFATAAGAARKQDDAAAFVKLLVEAARQTDLPIYVAITMRSDFIGDCARFRDLPEAVTAGLYLIPRMSRDQRRSAIEEPVRVGKAEISRRLINRLLNDGGDDPDQLPSLQHALMRTWSWWERHRRNGEPIDLEDYTAVGGMAEALSLHAEEAFAELPDERHRTIAKRLFQSLTEKGPDNREVRRPTRVAEIAAMANAEVAEVISVIEYFRREGRSFLMPPPEVPLDGESVIDISHESLIRGWARLRNWVEEEYESAKMYRRLAETAALRAEGRAGLWHDPDLSNALVWQEREKPTAAWARCYNTEFERAMAFLEESRRARDEETAERERNRKQKLRKAQFFAATVGVLFLIAAAAAAYAFLEWKTANSQKELASSREQQASAAESRAVAARSEAERNLAKAQAAETEAGRRRQEADAARGRAVEQERLARENQDMALDYASSTVRGFSNLRDFILSQHDVQDEYESVLKDATKVPDKVLQRDANNFQAMVMRANIWSAFIRLYRVTGRTDLARKECADYEGRAAEFAQPGNSYFLRVLGAYVFAQMGDIRKQLNEKDAALADAGRAASIADEAGSAARQNMDASDDVVWRCRSLAYSGASGVEDRYGLLQNALKHATSAIDVFTDFPSGPDAFHPAHSLSDRSRQTLLMEMSQLAQLQLEGKQKDLALGTFAKGIALAKQWTSAASADPNMIDRLCWLYISRGDAEKQSNQYEEARADFSAAQTSALRLVATTTGQWDRAVVEDRLGTLSHDRAERERDAARRREGLRIALHSHENSLKTFRQMEEKRGRNPDLERNAGVAERNMGSDYFALQELDNARGRYLESLTSYQLAAELDPSDERTQSVAAAYRSLGYVEQKAGKPADALDYYRKAADADERIAHPDADASHQLLSDARDAAGLAMKLKRNAVALGAYAEAIRCLEGWANGAAGGPALSQDLVSLYVARAEARVQMKDFGEAEKDFASAASALKRLDVATSEGQIARIFVDTRAGTFWHNRADSESDAPRRQDYLRRALDAHARSLTVGRQMEKANRTADVEQNVGIAEFGLGWDSLALEDRAAGLKHFQASVSAFKEALALSPTDQLARSAAGGYRTIGSMETTTDREDGLANYINAVEMDAKINDPDADASHQLLSDAREAADLAMKLGRSKSAVEAYSAAIRRAGEWTHGADADPSLVRDLVWLYMNRADIRLQEKNYPEAEKDLASARTSVQRLDSSTGDGQFMRSLVEERLGNLWLSRAGSEKDPAGRDEDLKRALDYHVNALKGRRQMESAGKNAELEHNLCIAEANVALDYLTVKDTDSARKHYQAGVDACKLAAKLEPGAEAARNLAAAYRYLAALETQASNLPKAVEAYGNQIEVLKPLAEGQAAATQDKESLAAAFGIRSWENALLGNSREALSDAEAGLSLDPSQLFILGNKGDAYLVLGRFDEARRIYLQLADMPAREGSESWRDVILGDLKELGKHPELKVDPRVLARIENELRNRPPAAAQNSPRKP